MNTLRVGERQPESNKSRAGAIGELFHAYLEYHAPPGAPLNPRRLASRLGVENAVLSDTEERARALIANPSLKHFFDPDQYQRARNELAFVDNNGQVQRIDRLVEFENETWVLDYKTGAADLADTETALSRRYHVQLQSYVEAVKTLLPGKPVRAGIILADGRFVVL